MTPSQTEYYTVRSRLVENFREIIAIERKYMALALSGKLDVLHATTAVRRVTERVLGQSDGNSRFAAQMALARIVGNGNGVKAYVAVLEVGDQFCRAENPLCDQCPLSHLCAYAHHAKRVVLSLPLEYS